MFYMTNLIPFIQGVEEKLMKEKTVSDLSLILIRCVGFGGEWI